MTTPTPPHPHVIAKSNDYRSRGRVLCRLPYYFSLAAEQMYQGSNRSALGSDDVTDESASMADVRWSSGDEEVLKNI